MGGGFKQIAAGAGLAGLCMTILAATAGGSIAGERIAYGGPATAQERSSYIPVGEPTRPPIGWVEFCIRYKPECDTRPSAARDVVLTQQAWSDMVKVNNWVNTNITPITDLEHWGVVEQWDYPDDGKGDCEDYV